MNTPNYAPKDTDSPIGPLIAWTEDKIALLESRLELARLKGEEETHIDGRVVWVEYGEILAKSLRLEINKRKRDKANNITGLM